MSARSKPPALRFDVASEADAPGVAALLNAAADDLTRRFGQGPWSGQASVRSVILSISPPVAGVRRSVTSQVFVARAGRGRSQRIIGTLRLATKKPWAIDVAYFTPVARALYLTCMAVDPALQGRGIGRRMLEEAARLAAEFPTSPCAEAIRLDAYDAGDREAGAGGFYRKCGYREVGYVRYRGTPLVYCEMLL